MYPTNDDRTVGNVLVKENISNIWSFFYNQLISCFQCYILSTSTAEEEISSARNYNIYEVLQKLARNILESCNLLGTVFGRNDMKESILFLFIKYTGYILNPALIPISVEN